jgi:nitrogen fixation NifU-like protein
MEFPTNKIVSHRFGVLRDHLDDPQHCGRLAASAQIGQAGARGAFGVVVVSLRLEGETIQEIRHESHGCGYTIACGSMLTEWAMNRSVSECLALTADEFADGIDGLPIYKRHCPGLVVAALHAALRDR